MRAASVLLLSVSISAAFTGAVGPACAQIGTLPFAPIGRPIGPWGPFMGPRRMFGMPPMFRRRFFGPPRAIGIMPGPGPGPRGFVGPGGRVCFTPAETREKIATHGLADPFRALQPDRLQGEALRARLCRGKGDQFIYDIAVLRRDGRIVHVYMNAQTGKSIGSIDDSKRSGGE